MNTQNKLKKLSDMDLIRRINKLYSGIEIENKYNVNDLLEYRDIVEILEERCYEIDDASGVFTIRKKI